MDTPEVEIARLRSWLTRFKASSTSSSDWSKSSGSVMKAITIAEKIERVLAGEETLGIASCVVCGATETDRNYSIEKIRWLDSAGTFHTVDDGAFCRAEPCSSVVQRDSACPGCYTRRWLRHICDDRELMDYFDDAGTPIRRCPGCDVPLAKSYEDYRRITQMVYEAAGYRKSSSGIKERK